MLVTFIKKKRNIGNIGEMDKKKLVESNIARKLGEEI